MNRRIITTTLAALGAVAWIGTMTATASAFTACQVTDTGGVDDKGFNQNAWKGVLDAEKDYGIQGKVLESKAETDYVPNINSFLGGKCDIIITVGFLLGDATKAAAEANPNQKFAIVDFSYEPTIPNVLGLTFQTDEAAFLAGYLSAGVSKTGVVGTFGGINIPPVTIFMNGFAYGIDYYDKQKGKDVKLLGWDPKTKEGLFTNNFESLSDGRDFAQNLNQEGADIVMPVAGPVGQGSAALAQELGPSKLKIVGVDTDQYISDPDHKGVFLTSVLKRMDVTVEAAIKQAMDGTFKGGIYSGTLANNGVGLAPYHDLASAVPDALKAEVDQLKKDIADGKVKVSGM